MHFLAKMAISHYVNTGRKVKMILSVSIVQIGLNFTVKLILYETLVQVLLPSPFELLLEVKIRTHYIVIGYKGILVKI